MIREFDSFTARLDGVNLIEAAAGTGKTYNIENLVLRFVLERQLPVTSIVVVTYTEAAAMELRERIRRMFRAVAAAASAADPERVCRLRTGENADYRLAPRELRLFEQGVAATSEEDFSAGVQVVLRLLKRAVADFDRAPVGTIHSFCNRILAEHAFSGIEGGNGRLDQEGGEAADQFIDDFYRGSFYGGADAELRRNCFVPLAAKLLRGSEVKVCCVVGFPLGAMSTPAKALTMIRVRRLWRSTNVPPNTLHTCWATIEADPIHPAVTVEPEMW